MNYNKPRLFLVSLLALATAGIHFAIRSSVVNVGLFRPRSS